MEIDNSNRGLCPRCLGTVIRPENGNVGSCACNQGNFNFSVAHILLQEALLQGMGAIKDGIIEELPKIFKLKNLGVRFDKSRLADHIKIIDIGESPFLYELAVKIGAETIEELISAKKKEIRDAHGLEISSTDAAAIISFMHLMRGCRDRNLEKNVRVQDINGLEKNIRGEFVLSDCAFGPGNEILIEDENCIITGSSDTGVRFEKKGRGMWLYVKSEQCPVVVIYRSFNHPPNSGIYIIH